MIRKRKRKSLIVLGILFLLMLGNGHSVSASEYGGPTEIVKETITEIKDNTMSSQGWVAVQAKPPKGFEGTICVELQPTWSFRKEIIEISAIESYLGGGWIPAGKYRVVNAYMPDGNNHFIVTPSATEIEVSTEQDALITLSLELNQETDDERKEVSSNYTEPIYFETQEPTEATTTATEITEVEIDETNTLFSPLQQFLLYMLFSTALLLCVVVFILCWRNLFH